MNAVLGATLPGVCLIGALLYCGLALVHLAIVPKHVAEVIVPLCFASGLVYGALHVWLRRHPVSADFAHPVFMAMMILAVSSTFTHTWLDPRPSMAGTFGLVALACGLLMSSRRWLVLALAVVGVAWWAVAAANWTDDGSWRDTSFGLGFSAVLAVMMHSVHRRSMSRMFEALRGRDILMRALREGEEGVRRHSDVLHALATSPALTRGDIDALFREVVGASSHALDSESASIWLLSEDGTELACSRRSTSQGAVETSDRIVFRADHLHYFEVLESDRVIDTSEVAGPLGEATLDAPIRVGSRVAGVLSQERSGPQRPWRSDERSFVASAAELAGLGIQWSERLAMEEESRRLQAEVQEARRLESLGRMAGGVAHDFNNMLAVVLGNTELVLAEVTDDEICEGMLEVQEAALQAADLARQILVYSGHSSITPSTVDLAGVVEKAVGEVAGPIELVHEAASGGLVVQADANRLGQALKNIVVNATEAVGASGGRVRIRTGVRRGSSQEGRTCHDAACIEIQDDGTGIAQDVEQKMFDPFFTTKPNGRGLGLAVARGVVVAHGGKLEVETRLGRGTTVRILLPLEAVEPSRRSTPPAVRASSDRGRILVVDDDAAVRRVTRAMLEQEGFEVVEASGVADGLRRSSWYRDLQGAVIDLRMGDGNGVTLAKRLAVLRPNLSIVLMSGYDHERVAAGTTLQPEIPVLSKPFTRVELLGALTVVRPPAPARRFGGTHAPAVVVP